MPLLDMTERRLPSLIDLTGRVAVVTGGGRGIGAAIVRRLAEAGADVLVGDLDERAARATAEKHDGRTGRVVSTALDVGDPASNARAADMAVNTLGDLHIWVNNAAIGPSQGLLDISGETWDTVLGVNLRGAFLGAREAATRMIRAEHGGVVVNIASTTSFNSGRGTAPAHYVASKHALAGLTKSLAVELAPHGVRAVAVAPTLTETPGMAVLSSDPTRSEGLAAYGRAIPAGRIGVPDDTARVVLFAVSDLAGFVTGSVLAADGGDLAG